MEIKILGTGCPKCNRLEALAKDTASELGVEATFTKVQDIDGIIAFDILTTPGLVIDGEVKSAGRVPTKSEIEGWLREARRP